MEKVIVDNSTHVKYVCGECGFKNPCVLFIDRDCTRPILCSSIYDPDKSKWKIELT